MKKRLDGGKRAQILGMPFIVIFSIILIAVFIFVAIWAGKSFLERANQAKVALFLKQLDGKVSLIWTATEARQSFAFDLPTSIKYVCFANVSKGAKLSLVKAKLEERPFLTEMWDEISGYRGFNANLFFFPPEVLRGWGTNPYYKVTCGAERKDCLSLEAVSNPFCLRNEAGRLQITLVKELGSRVVEIVE